MPGKRCASRFVCLVYLCVLCLSVCVCVCVYMHVSYMLPCWRNKRWWWW